MGGCLRRAVHDGRHNREADGQGIVCEKWGMKRYRMLNFKNNKEVPKNGLEATGPQHCHKSPSLLLLKRLPYVLSSIF
jgi:hypothetical protein